jgi:hypothetical protein
MKFQFIGKHFMFEKDCTSNEDVSLTVTRCSRKSDVRGHEVNMKITEIWQAGEKKRIYPVR